MKRPSSAAASKPGPDSPGVTPKDHIDEKAWYSSQTL